MKKFTSLITGIFLTSFVFGQNGTLKIVIPNIPSEKGNIKVAIYNEAGSKGFLKDLNLSYRKKEVAIKNKTAVIIFKNIPYGIYAVSLFQDENNNGEIDRAPIGFPVEPYGISGNKNTVGPPRFNDGKFVLKSSNLSLKIILKTYLKRNF